MDALGPLLIHFLKVLNQLGLSLENKGDFESLLRKYGFDLAVDEVVWDSLEGIKELRLTIGQLYENADQFTSPQALPAKEQLKTLKRLAKEIKNCLLLILQLNESAKFDLAPFNDPSFWSEIKTGILHDLLVYSLKHYYPLVYSYLLFTGGIVTERIVPTGSDRTPYIRNRVYPDRWHPSKNFLDQYYHWGTSSSEQPFLWEILLDNMQQAFSAVGLSSRFFFPAGISFNEIFLSDNYSDKYQLKAYQLPYIHSSSLDEETFYNFGIGVTPFNQKGTDEPPDSMLLFPIIQGKAVEAYPLGNDIMLQVDGLIDADVFAALLVTPDGAKLQVEEGVNANLAIELTGAPDNPWIILGSRNAHRLELHGFELSLAIVGDTTDPEVKLSFRTTAQQENDKSIQAFFRFDDADSFLKETIQQEQLQSGLDLIIEWSSKTGFRLGGSAGLNYELALNQNLGPITLTKLSLELLKGPEGNSTGNPPVRFRTGLDLKGEIGPVQFLMEKVGFTFDAIPYTLEEARQLPEPPLLGLIDLDFGFAPPAAVGFSVDAGAVRGGGFLSVDAEKGVYIGFGELAVLDKFNLKAFALINTRLPDGQSGYSFLLMISSEFAPLPLGLGFSLEGVGGLVGLHRGLHLDNIRRGVKSGSYDQLLFPENPLANLPAIFTGLNEIMPIEKGRYAFGIMAQITWGSPKLLEIKAGLLLEIPSWEMALIGVAKAEIKRNDRLLARLQVDFALTFDPAIALFTLDASLSDSKLLSWSLSGDLALRIRGGDDPYFLLSAGGFHKGFQPPAALRLPSMERLKIVMADGNPSITAEAFFAITSNTIQFGASARATYTRSGIGFEADLGFAALIQFDPLYFKAEVWGGVYLKFFGASFGLDLKGTIEGPRPLVFNLYVTFKIWIWKKTVRVPTVSIGEKAPGQLESIEVAPILIEQLQDNRNWQAVLPVGAPASVTLRAAADGTATDADLLKFHPVGDISINQSRVPLNRKLDRFGHHRPGDYQQFALEIEAAGYEQQSLQTDFAPAQYFDLKEEEIFRSRAFEKLESGVLIRSRYDIAAGSPLEKVATYEELIFDLQQQPMQHNPDKPEDSDNFHDLQAGSTIVGSEPGRRHERRQLHFRRRSSPFLLVDARTMAPAPEARAAMTQSEAEQLLREIIEREPAREGQLEIMPAYELAE